ncbi:PulJ/GspJ family protein [Pseudomonas sp. MT3]|nr:prepilin-type N-terminal cleavage/methylation domain-containing protein [uncultured Pseudomonas sp.]
MSRRQAGFTLLEAVVAMTLLVVVGGALLAWLNSGFVTVERMADVQRRLDASRVALAYLEQINPSLQHEGQVHLGPYTLEWTCDALVEARPVVGRHSGAPGPYDAALYRVKALILEEHADPIELFVELPGFQRTRVAQDAGGDE